MPWEPVFVKGVGWGVGEHAEMLGKSETKHLWWRVDGECGDGGSE